MGFTRSKKVPAAQIYSQLPAGPGWQREYEIQPGVPVDGSKASLRDPTYGSPFTFRIMPPDVLLSALSTTEQPTNVNLIDGALKKTNDFKQVRDQIAAFRTTGVVATSDAEIQQLEALIAGNGFLFDPNNSRNSPAFVPAVSDLVQASNVILQLNRALQVPPLTLLVNPQSLSISYQVIQNYSDRTRYGYIFQRWGEEQVRLSVTGKTGAFIAGVKTLTSGDIQNFQGLAGGNQATIQSSGGAQGSGAVSGVQWASKRDSAAWQNLMSLYTFYRNNGYIYDNLEQTEAHLFIGSIAIDYDQNTWIGHFENFEFGFDEETQHGGIEFSFEFVADFVYDNAQREFQVLPIAAPTPSPSAPLWQQKRQQQSRPTAVRVNATVGGFQGATETGVSVETSNATGIFSPFNT
jgi:hypothetical protein